MRPYRRTSGVVVVDPNDGTWLPPHVPTDVMLWKMEPRPEGGSRGGFVQVCGIAAYEFLCVADGRAVEIIAYIDGEKTHHWRRDPIEGTWPGTYEWQAVAIYGQGLVPITR